MIIVLNGVDGCNETSGEDIANRRNVKSLRGVST